MENTNCQTILVMGLGRGGTSSVAKIMDHLGIFMGKTEEFEPSWFGYDYEDWTFTRESYPLAFEGKHSEIGDKIKPIIEERNKTYNVWGWKDQLLYTYIEQIISSVRNPYVICVWRDVFAMAQSIHYRDADDAPLSGTMLNRLRDYTEIINWVRENDGAYPVLHCSFERILRNKKYEIDRIVKFLKLNPTGVQIEKAYASVINTAFQEVVDDGWRN